MNEIANMVILKTLQLFFNIKNGINNVLGPLYLSMLNY